MLPFALDACSASGTGEEETRGGFHLPPACSVAPASRYDGVISPERVSNRKYCSLVPVAVCDGSQTAITP